MDNIKAALEAAAKSLMDHSLDHGDESYLHAASVALSEAAKTLEPAGGKVYGPFEKLPQWESGKYDGYEAVFRQLPYTGPSLDPAAVLVELEGGGGAYLKWEKPPRGIGTAYVNRDVAVWYKEQAARANVCAEKACQSENLWNTQWEEALASNKKLESKLAQAEAAAQQMEGEANNWRERYYAFKAHVAKLVGYDE
tara:strand:+ start:758 stop:1345 length:588 start_codon:yes stop_codon:yes gene_type:complete